MFHATDDCQEVREKVFRLLKKSDFTFYCIVARKKEDLFRKKFDLQSAKLYEYLVSKLLENRLHLYTEIDLYFSAMGNTVRQKNMSDAVQKAYQNYDFRYYNYIKEKINLIHDIFDFGKYPKNYYTPKNSLEAKKIDPV